MNILKLGLALASTFGVLTSGPLDQPSVAQSTASVVAQSQSQAWSYQIDAATLKQYLNAWAATQGALQTPLEVRPTSRFLAQDEVGLDKASF